MQGDNKNKKKPSEQKGVSRRTFIKSVSLSSIGVAAVQGDGLLGQLKAAGIVPKENIIKPGPMKAVFLINGEKMTVTIETHTTLAEVLREKLDYTGTKIGCNRGACGACTVIVDGKAVCSCMTLALDAIGLSIQTIEGLAPNENRLHPLQESFIQHDALQCGFCTPGMIMSSKHLLDNNSSPDLEEIKNSLSGNLCRCGTYPKVFEAVEAVVKDKK